MTPGELKHGDRVRVVNLSRQRIVAQEVLLALDPWRRLRGLIGRRPLVAQQALLLRPCQAVHTCFMAYAIDVAFLDGDGLVTALAAGLAPWRVSGVDRRARCALELSAGGLTRSGTQVGDRLAFEPCE